MSTVQLTTATVKFGANQPRETQFGPRINVVVTLSNGEEVKLWGNPGDPQLTALKKGQSIQLIHDGKGYKVVEQPQPSSPVPSPALTPESKPRIEWEHWTEEEKQILMLKIKSHADVLDYCIRTAFERFGKYDFSTEDLRALATTLFISAMKG